MNEKVLLVDDHTLFREGLSNLLSSRGIDILAAVACGADGLAQLELHQQTVDIVMLDMRMPEHDGLEVLQQIKKHHPKTPVAMLTTSAEERDVIGSLRAGANGYLLKDMEPDQLVVAIREIIAGKTVVAPDLSAILAKALQGNIGDEEEDPFAVLTPREYEILTLLAEGQSNKVMARNLGISDGTVKLHVKSILRKLNLNSRITAAVMAVKHGVKRKVEEHKAQ